MKSIRQNRKDLFLIALVAIALGVFNIAMKRFIDGTLCTIVGAILLLIYQIKRNK